MIQNKLSGFRMLFCCLLMIGVMLCGSACSTCSEQETLPEENQQANAAQQTAKPKPVDRRKQDKMSTRPFNQRASWEVNPFGYLFRN